jgi:hypothetical protein
VREGERVGCHGFGNQNDQAWCQWVLLNDNSSMILDFFTNMPEKKNQISFLIFLIWLILVFQGDFNVNKYFRKFTY